MSINATTDKALDDLDMLATCVGAPDSSLEIVLENLDADNIDSGSEMLSRVGSMRPAEEDRDVVEYASTTRVVETFVSEGGAEVNSEDIDGWTSLCIASV